MHELKHIEYAINEECVGKSPTCPEGHLEEMHDSGNAIIDVVRKRTGTCQHGGICTTCQGPGFINQADLFSGCPDCKGSGLSQKKAAKVILDNPMGTWQEAMLHDHEAQLEEQAVRLKELESTGRHHNARMLELEQHQGRDRADLTNEILNQKRQIEYVSQTVRDLGAPVSKLENAQTAQQEKPVEPEMVICNQSTCCGNTICHCHEPHPRCSHCKKQYCNYFDAKTQCMPVKRG